MTPPVHPPDQALRALAQLYSVADPRARIAHDPVRAVHRYTTPADQEIAGFLAAGFAFGRVGLFLPIVDALLERLDDLGGPAAAVDRWKPALDERLSDLGYRWIRGSDLGVVLSALGAARGPNSTLEPMFGRTGPLAQRLEVFVQALRVHASRALVERGRPPPLTRGVATFMPSPAKGSACKRLNLWLRWMVRPPTEGVDVGIWTHLRPADLVIPVDVHIGRLARYLGLTARKDASWRTAEQITDALRRLCPEDPVRYDFALAHLGISKACLGRRHPDVCPSCPLDRVCLAP